MIYTIKAQKMAFFGALPEKLNSIREVPKSMWIALVVMAVVCIALGLACPWFITNLVEPARDVLLNPGVYIKNVLE